MGRKIDKCQDKWMILIISMGCLSLSACSSPGRSSEAGAAIGAGIGATAGLLADPGDGGNHRIRNVLIGTGVGGALGAGAGLWIGNSVEADKQAAFTQGKSSGTEGAVSPDGQSPRLVPAKTEARWVPDQVHGNIFIPAHFEYLIVVPSHWSP